MVIVFIDESWNRFGVEPTCRVPMAHGCPSTYYAGQTRVPSVRALRDADLVEKIKVKFWDRKNGRGISRFRKMWRLLKRDGIEVARCAVERLMRQQGLRGIRRGKQFITTRPDVSGPRPPDLVDRVSRRLARMICRQWTDLLPEVLGRRLGLEATVSGGTRLGAKSGTKLGMRTGWFWSDPSGAGTWPET